MQRFRFSIFDIRFSGGMLAMLLLLAFAPAALATDPIFLNNSQLYYTIPGTPPPQIDALAVDNEATYSVTYNTWINNQVEFCEPWWNTKFFTNNGAMIVNAPFPTNFNFFSFSSTGVGFEFDTQAGNSNVLADTFYNSGAIRCDSVLDGNNTFDFGIFSSFFQTSIGECVVSATNIINPGQVIVGASGLMKFTGTNVDLSSSTLMMEGTSANVFGSGVFGLNTNFWDPSAFLTATTAESAFFPVAPFFLDLTNSTAYFHFTSVDPNNEIIQGVFVEDTSGSNVTQNVYFGIPSDPTLGFGGVTIEWAGSYLDAASGQTFSNYLYLNNDYILGASTNVTLTTAGYPDNFTFTESPTKLIFQTPATAGFANIFPAGSISNFYSFANVQLVSSTTATNASNRNPSGALTNLPGRLYITAGRDLDLSQAAISGPNYTSIQSPNQFEGSAGAQIITPYADINVGVTNGFLTVSNLMQPTIPNWSGTVQAWNTRFISVDAFGVTNDFRVLIVGSQLNASTLAYVQDLILHGTNSLVLADNFNVLRKLSVDSQNLTLATNGPGNGATSLDGELNLFPPITWSTAVPNLKNLTNNGAIRIASPNLAQFGNNTTTYVTNVTPATSSVAATGTLSELMVGTNVIGTNVTKNSKVTIGTNVYTFVNIVTNKTANQIKIASKFDGTMSNLIAAINKVSPAGTNTYSTNTAINHFVYAGSLLNHAFVVTARTNGSIGNTIATTTTATNLTWNGHVALFGGVNAVPASTNVTVIPPQHYGALINNGLITDQGADVWADNFVSFGTFSNGVGSFTLHSLSATLTNLLTAGGSVSITADTLGMSNLTLQANRSLTLTATNLLTDGGSTNNFWVVGTNATALTGGINLPIKPPLGDLLGTTITNFAPQNVNVSQVWAGQDRGVSVNGFANNEAIGRLILDALPSPNNPGITSQNGKFTFNGVGASNALYVDYIELRDAATNTDGGNNFIALNMNTNMVIYYAQAVMNGSSIASKMNGKNNNRLRWVPQYVGQFSSVQIIYPDGTTNTFNAALAASGADSDGDGIKNADDPTPFFTVNEMNVTTYVTNLPPSSMAIQWNSIPSSTNTVSYSTNMVTWLTLTNFVSPTNRPPIGGWPITNIMYDPIVGPSRFYNVTVIPNSALFYSP